MEVSKISAFQAFTLLFLCRMFDVITYSPITSGNTEGTLALLSGAISLISTAILVIPLLFFYHKYGEKDSDIIDIMLKHNKIFGYICFCIFFFAVAIAATFSVIVFSDFMLNTIDSFSEVFIIITILTACIYAASLNIEGISRASLIVFVFFILSVLLIVIACADAINTSNFKPIVNLSAQNLFSNVFGTITRNVEVIGLILLFPKIKKDFVKTTFFYVILSGVFGLAIWFVLVLILGDYIYTQVYPFLTVSSLVELGKSVQRLDGLHMTLWITVAFVKTTFYLVLLKNLFGKVLPTVHKKNTMFFVTGVVMLFLVAFNSSDVYKDFLNYPVFTIIPILASVLIIPIIAIVVSSVKSKHSGGK